MDGVPAHSITTLDDLAALYGAPHERVLKKQLDHVDALGRAFITASPFCVLATSGPRGLDCSPKGDGPGFVTVSEDGRVLMIPDRRGNNRLDGIKNIIADPRVALIFFAPGANETYRVNGRARISADPALCRRFAVGGRAPATVTVVAVEEAFQHCPKALVRSNLWRHGAGPRPKVPTLGDYAAARDPAIDPGTYNDAYEKRLPDELY